MATKSTNKKLWLILLIPLIFISLTMACLSSAVAIDSAPKTSGTIFILICFIFLSLGFAAFLGWLTWRIFHPSQPNNQINQDNRSGIKSDGKSSVLDIFHVKQLKSELEGYRQENIQMKKVLSETGRMTVVEIHAEIERLTTECTRIEEEAKNRRAQVERELQADIERVKTKRSQAEQEIGNLKNEIDIKKKDLIVLEEELLLQSFGFYKTKYPFDNSEQYKVQIERIRDQQAQMIKAGTAASCSHKWTVEGSAKEGQRMTADYIKLIIRSFNNECDASIVNVKFNNIESIEKKIRKAFETLNKLGSRLFISLSQEYLNLKLQELYLCYEYQVKKQEEKEEQKRLKEQMREEAKLLKEIEEAKLRIAKEEKHFANALQKIQEQLSQANTEEVRSVLLEKKSELESQLVGLEKDKLNVLNREQNTRAGYVYVISNIGSFGENVYKIGVTRRLDPTERVDELGDASVPFDFDIHAVIFSDDAPRLETALHKAFDNRRLNMINNRREFFQVTLDEIEAEVKKNFNKTVEFTRLADAAEFRQSSAIRQTKLSLN